MNKYFFSFARYFTIFILVTFLFPAGVVHATTNHITTCVELEAIADNISGSYVLDNDIDCSGVASFTQIGSYASPFTGTLDGQGYEVSNIHVSTTYAGLFSRIGAGGVVQNLGLVDIDYNASTYSGAFTSYLEGTLSHVYASGSLDCTVGAYCGGLAGYTPEVTAVVTSSYSNVNIIGGTYMGGIIGRFSTGTIANVYASGVITGSQKKGIIGSVDGGVTPDVTGAYFDATRSTASSESFSNSKTTAQMMSSSTFSGWDFTVAGDGTIGDWIMAGYPHLQMEHRSTITTLTELQLTAVDLTGNYTLSNDINASSTTGWNGGAGFDPIGTLASKFTGSFDGGQHVISNLFISRTDSTYVGLFGYVGSGASITKIGLEDIAIHSLTYSGGLVGANQGTISESYTTGVVTSTGQAIGGLVGYNNGGTVSNSYSSTSVSSTINTEIGGLVGWNNAGTITNSYSRGLVNNGIEAHSGMDTVGGLVGFSFGGTISNSFWDEDTSGQNYSPVGTGKTTAQMKAITTFTDTDTSGLTTAWDFVGTPYNDAGTSSTWEMDPAINSGYAFLAWQYSDSNAPSSATSLIGSGVNSDITLSWTNPTESDFVSITVRRSTTSYPSTVSDGTAVVSATTTTSFTQTSLDDGTYYYSVFALDNTGNVSSAVTTSVAIDITAPTIILLGSATVSQSQGHTYSDAGATATDAIDGDITNNITTSGSVNTSVPGTYTITYSVSDAAGNAATSVSRTVIILSVGGAFIPPGGVGDGSSDRSIDMYKTKHIGEISVDGINLLAYIHATALFSIIESSSGLLEEHHLTITDLDLSEQKEVALVFASSPQTISLKLGKSADVDLDSDGVSDLSATFVALWNNRVELTLKAIQHNEEKTMSIPQQSEEKAVSFDEKETAQCPSSLFVVDMKKGLYGPSALALQKYLNSIGIPVALSGPGSSGQETLYFGSLTEQALIVFQKGHSLATTGVFDSATRSVLGCVVDTTTMKQTSVSVARDLKFGMRGEDVKRLQVYLNTNGFPVATSGYGFAGNETTYFGELTRQAVIAFQTAKGILPASGYVGPLTRQELR